MSENRSDQAARFAAKIDPPEFLTWVLELPAGHLGFGGWLDTRAIPFPGEPDRTGDLVARLDPPDGGAPFALAVEFQIEPDPLMFGRLLTYLAQVWQTLKPDAERGSRYSVGAAVLNLTGSGTASRDMRLPGTPLVTQLVVAERNLSRESAGAALGRIEAGLLGRSVLPWLTLMSGGGDATIIDRWKRAAEAEPDFRRRGNYAGLALVFAEAAGLATVWATALEGWNVIESQVVNGWIALGEERGRTQGKAEGKAEGQADALVALLEEQFGAVPDDLAAAVRACTDLVRLRQWLGAAVRAESVAAFRVAAGV